MKKKTVTGKSGTAENEPRYVISVAARILGTRSYTLRYYEKIGIIEPSRSVGNIRLYSESDIIRLRHARTLIEDLGINLAGVGVILHMADRVEELQERIDELEQELDKTPF
jgi:MerR family transcriptional regulator, heat shock protein HspR